VSSTTHPQLVQSGERRPLGIERWHDTCALSVQRADSFGRKGGDTEAVAISGEETWMWSSSRALTAGAPVSWASRVSSI
jgi:hypothetical protein